METPVRRCEECGDASEPDDVRGYRVNVVLGGILCKWFPARWRAVELRRQGNGLYADGKTEEALGKYNEAVLMGKVRSLARCGTRLSTFTTMLCNWHTVPGGPARGLQGYSILAQGAGAREGDV